MKVLHIIGADLSKKTIDFATSGGIHIKVSNDSAGYQEFTRWLKKQKIDILTTMIVMEHTGLYSLPVGAVSAQAPHQFYQSTGLCY